MVIDVSITDLSTSVIVAVSSSSIRFLGEVMDERLCLSEAEAEVFHLGFGPGGAQVGALLVALVDGRKGCGDAARARGRLYAGDLVSRGAHTGRHGPAGQALRLRGALLEQRARCVFPLMMAPRILGKGHRELIFTSPE